MAQAPVGKLLPVTIRELSPDDCDYDLLRKLAQRIQVTDPRGVPSDGISIYRESFNDQSTGTYFIRENGSGTMLGLYKKVNGQLLPITFPLPGEMRLIKGDGLGELKPPIGWKLVDDPELQSKYNTGVSPNWTSALIEYVGI